MPLPRLHVIPQRYEHDELQIIGNVAGFEKLRDSINGFLARFDARKITGILGTETHGFFPADGEGYSIIMTDYDSHVPNDKSNYSDE